MNRKEGANRSPTEGGSSRPLPFRDDAQLASKRPPARVPDTHDSPKKKKKKEESNFHGNSRPRPKRPLTGYNRFFREERVKWKEEQSKQEKTEAPSKDNKHAFLTMGKEISARWVRLPREQKQIYTAEYDKEMLQYRSDVEKYNREKGEEGATEEEEQNDVHLTEMSAHTENPIGSSVSGSSLQEPFNMQLQQQQLLASQFSTAPFANLSASSISSPLNGLLQQRQLATLLQHRLLEQQLQRQSNLLSVNNLLLGGNTMGTQSVTNALSSNFFSNLNFSEAASAYAGSSRSAGNVQAQMLGYSRGGLFPESNPYSLLPGPLNNLAMGDVSTGTNEQLLLSLLLQQQHQQQQDGAKSYPSPKKS